MREEFESTDDGHTHGSESEAALRAAIARRARGEASEGELGAALRRYARDAQRRHLRAEEVVIAFKSMWRALPEASDAFERQEQQRLLERLVTLCIREYYGES